MLRVTGNREEGVGKVPCMSLPICWTMLQCTLLSWYSLLISGFCLCSFDYFSQIGIKIILILYRSILYEHFFVIGFSHFLMLTRIFMLTITNLELFFISGVIIAKVIVLLFTFKFCLYFWNCMLNIHYVENRENLVNWCISLSLLFDVLP